MDIFKEWSKSVSPWLLSHGLKILLIAASGFILNKVAWKFIERTVKFAVDSNRFLSKEDEKKRQDTLIRIFTWTCSILILILACLMILQETGIPIGPLLASAGILGLAVGFGGQYLIRDIISGFFIILENQYRIGDVVNFDGTAGLVEDISLRMTTLRDLDGTVHHIPHGEIKRVANLSKDFSRINLNIRVSYHSSLDHIIHVINETGNKLAEDPQWKEFVIVPPQFLRVDDFTDSAMVLKILGETLPLKQWDVTGELRKRIKLAFDKEGIQIPFPHLVIETGRKN